MINNKRRKKNQFKKKRLFKKKKKNKQKNKKMKKKKLKTQKLNQNNQKKKLTIKKGMEILAQKVQKIKKSVTEFTLSCQTKMQAMTSKNWLAKFQKMLLQLSKKSLTKI